MGEATDNRDAVRQRRMAAIIAGLKVSGIVKTSCDEAGVRPPLAQRWRGKYPRFGEEWREAMAHYETARLSALTRSTKPARSVRWTPARIERFIDVMATTGNVTAAAQAANVSRNAVYSLRRRDAAFRAAWASAVDQGYAQVEIGMIDEAINGVAPRAEGDRPAASERIRSSVYAAGLKRAAMLRQSSEDEAERDRVEALAAKWIADLRAAILRRKAETERVA
jgi:hypothetical protein